MSRPISIANTHNSDQLASPIESLGKSVGAQKIVDSICGSPIKSYGRHVNTKNDRLPDTPEFQFASYMHHGGKAVGQNTVYMFGTPPRCVCSQENIPSITNNTTLSSINNNCPNPNWNSDSVFTHHPQMTQLFQQSAAYDAHFATARNYPGSAFSDTQMHQVQTQQSVLVPVQPSSIGIFANSLRENAASDDLLTRYRANPTMMKGLKLSDIRGNLLKFAKDQVGSRFIQQKLEYCDGSEKDAIFQEVVANAGELVDDIFGNYVVQKFFEYGEERHWAHLVEAIIDRVPDYAFQMYACRVLQKALEKVNEPLQIKILDKIKHVIHRCMKDQNGNHVIQKAIEKVSPEYIDFIVRALLETPSTVFDMSVDPYGCRVVQRCLEHCIPMQTTPIIERIHQRFDDIAINQYGNYVVQHVVTHGSKDDRMIIIERISSQLFEYASHKFSSNVIEKCLEQGDVYHKSLIVKAACYMPEGAFPIVVQMMKDQYANYVVQTMFDQVTVEQRRDLILTVRPHIPMLRQFPHGKHILAKLDKYFQRQIVLSYQYSDIHGNH